MLNRLGASIPLVGCSVSDLPSDEIEHGLGRVALVHDFLVDLRGAERVFLEIAAIFPEADLFSPIHDPVGTQGRFAGRGVEVSFLNRLHPTADTFRRLLPLYPRATESLDFGRYDTVISSSSAWAHGVLLEPGQRHLCYCHNTFRYAWDQRDEALKGRSRPVRAMLESVFSRWRDWDRRVAREVDLYVANSAITHERIARCYLRESKVLHPPVDVDRFESGPPGDEFVVLSELMPHKRIDVIVAACAAIGHPLTVIGDGPDLQRLRSLAGPATEFTGRISDEEVVERLSRAKALIQCATEEFGIASVEAQAAGRPVLALGAGGALETVLSGVTGEHFEIPEPEALAAEMRLFDPGKYRPEDCVRQAARFSRGAFASGILRLASELDGVPQPPRPRAERRGT